MSANGKSKLRLSDVAIAFGDHHVLRGVTLDIVAGARNVLIGPAASGKSVLMRCILGLYQPQRGRIELDGRDITRLRGQDRVELMEQFGVLFQRAALFDSLPVWHNVAFKLLESGHMPREEAREVAVAKLRLVGLEPEVADLMPAELSGGMQKRVGLARAVAADPDVLLLDDPTAGLDPIMTTAINRLIDRSVDELGATCFAITGDMASARGYSDYLAMLHQGQIIWSGRTEEIDDAPNEMLQQLIQGRGDGPIQMRVRDDVDEN